MQQYETSDIRKGLKVLINGEPHAVVTFEFVKPGKGNAFTRVRMKSLISGNVLDRTYKTGERLDKADLEDRTVQYLYAEGQEHVFMDVESFEQYHVPAENLGDAVNFVVENMKVDMLLFDGKPLSVELPNFVELDVKAVGAGSKADKVTGATKEAEVETGYKLQVPVFINEGDRLRIDTRTGEYVERAKK